jgi:APA family basic amino acid/polyamine antiporter
VAVQVLIVGANYLGTKRAGRLQSCTTGAKILLSVCFVLAGLRVARPQFSHPWYVSDGTGAILPGIISVVTIAPFWFSGFNAIAQTLGERARNLSSAKAAGMIVVSLLAAWAFYCLVLIAMTLTMPREQLLSYPLPTAGAFQVAFGSPQVGNVVLLAGLLGLISTWNALFFSATRILFALAENGLVSARFGTLHPRFATPTFAILLVGILIPLGALLGKGVIGPLLSAFSMVMAGIYAVVCYGVIILRRQNAAQPRLSTADTVPYLALVACVVIAGFAALEPLRAWGGGRLPLEWVMLLAWTLCGVWLIRRLHHRQRRDESNRKQRACGT